MSDKKRKRLSRRLKTQEVEIENEQGQPEVWVIKELTGAERNAFFQMSSERGAKRGEDGNMMISSFANLGADLLSMCLYGPDGQKATIQDINNFPSEMQLELFKDAQTLSALNKEGEQGAKKN